MVLFKKTAIIGLGLIGGSLAMAIKEKCLSAKVIGIARKPKTLKQAKLLGAIDEGYLDIRAVKDCDLIILCTPPDAIIKLFSDIAPFLSKGCIVSDVGSIKLAIVKAAQKALPKEVSFIGAHPLAGSEKKGIGYACGSIFKNSLCLLTPDKYNTKKNINKLRLLWEGLGAKVSVIKAGLHDKIISYTSHLPHLAAFSLIASVPKEYLNFTANSFRDLTRIAGSDPLLWAEIFLTNKKPILDSIKTYKKNLDSFTALVNTQNKKSLLKKIQMIKSKRERLSF